MDIDHPIPIEHYAAVAEIIGGGGDSAVIGWQGAMTAVAEGADGNILAYVGLVGPMVTYLLPLLIAMTAGRHVAGDRGGEFVGLAIAGVRIGCGVPADAGCPQLDEAGGLRRLDVGHGFRATEIGAVRIVG